jgi:hypothetical protein
MCDSSYFYILIKKPTDRLLNCGNDLGPVRVDLKPVGKDINLFAVCESTTVGYTPPHGDGCTPTV